MSLDLHNGFVILSGGRSRMRGSLADWQERKRREELAVEIEEACFAEWLATVPPIEPPAFDSIFPGRDSSLEAAQRNAWWMDAEARAILGARLVESGARPIKMVSSKAMIEVRSDPWLSFVRSFEEWISTGEPLEQEIDTDVGDPISTKATTAD